MQGERVDDKARKTAKQGENARKLARTKTLGSDSQVAKKSNVGEQRERKSPKAEEPKDERKTRGIEANDEHGRKQGHWRGRGSKPKE